MEKEPIKTEAGHEAALEEIERLMDAAPDSPEGERLDVLATLAEAYEAKHHLVADLDPIEASKGRPDR